MSTTLNVRPRHGRIARGPAGVGLAFLTMLALALAGPPAASAADTVAPTEPGAVTVTSVTATSAKLSWGRSTDNVGIEGYRVYRGPAGAADTALSLISTTDAVTSFSPTHLYSGTAYKFGIVALDAANNLSAMRTVTVTTAARTDTTAPAAPSSTGVTAKPFSSSRIDVDWGSSSSSDVAGYQVLRDGAVIATVDLPNATSYSDNGLAASSTHSYAVKAIDANHNLSAATTGRNGTTLAAGTRTIRRGPYLSRVTATSAVVSWWTNLATPGVVSWGVATATEHTVPDTATVQHHSVTLTGLPAGATVKYQVGDGAGLVSTASFRTAAPAGQTFSFAAIGDFGGNAPGEAQNANNIAGEGTSFIQTLGDNIYPTAGNPDPNFTTTYSDFDARFYKPFGAAVRGQAFFPANGNKEYYGDGVFWDNFPMPGSNHSYYSYDWGDAHILVLDTEQPFGTGTDQFAFAQADLAANQGATWRIVALQRPPYSSTSANSSSVPVRQFLVPLFQQENVSLVLSGNSHNYERTHPLIDSAPAAGGITYIVSGAGGNGFNAFSGTPPAYSAFRESTFYEHVRVTVSPTSLKVDAIRADTNTVFDTTTITAPGSTPADTTPPTAPTGVSATAASSSRVDVSWTAATDNVGVTAYDVLRDGVKVNTADITGTTFADTTVAPSTTYQYTVRARDAAGNSAVSAPPVSVTTPAGSPPPPPPGAPAFVRDATGSTTSGTTFTVPIASTAGDALVASVAIQAGSTASVSGVTDTAGGTWTKGAAGFLSGSSTRIELWYRTGGAAVSSVTVTLNTAKAASADVAEFSGVASASALDAAAGNTGTASSTTATTPALTTTNASDVLVGAINYPSSTTTATLNAPGFTALQPFAVSTVQGRAAYRIVSAAGTYQAAWTLSAAANSGGAILALKGA
jgi:chitodextrinase